MGLGVPAAEESGGLSSGRIWGSQKQKTMGLGVSAAEESGVSAGEESTGLSSRRIWPSGISAAEEYGTGGLSCRRIWGLSSSKGVSAACRASRAIGKL